MSNTQIKKEIIEEKTDKLDDNLFKAFQKIEDISEVEEILNGKGKKKVTNQENTSNATNNDSNVEDLNSNNQDSDANTEIDNIDSLDFSEEEQATEENQNNDPAAIVSQKDEEIKKLEDQLLRTLAEMQNLRQRTEKDVSEARKYGVTNFARDMIAVYENLTRAEESISQEDLEKNDLLKNVMEGVKLTQSELLKSFENQQIKSISPMGEKFNHNFHQAVVRIPDNNSEPNTVIQVMQSGYTIQDRLLRPAMVGVSVAAPAETKNDTAVEDSTPTE